MATAMNVTMVKAAAAAIKAAGVAVDAGAGAGAAAVVGLGVVAVVMALALGAAVDAGARRKPEGWVGHRYRRLRYRAVRVPLPLLSYCLLLFSVQRSACHFSSIPHSPSFSVFESSSVISSCVVCVCMCVP